MRLTTIRHVESGNRMEVVPQIAARYLANGWVEESTPEDSPAEPVTTEQSPDPLDPDKE